MARQQKKTKSFPLVRQFVVNLFLGGNLATLCLLWICCASTWIDPELHPRLSVVGLVFPVLLLLNMLFVPLWLIYKPRMLVVPIVGMALCGGFILDYFPMHYGSTEAEAELTVMTWNAHEYSKFKDDSLAKSYEFIVAGKADIMCFQELNLSRIKHKALRDTLDAHGYHYDNRRTRAIVSRYPILRMDTLEAAARSGNGILYADLLRDEGDTLTVLCVHLESNKLSVDDKTDYSDVIHTPESEKIKSEASYLSSKIGEAAYYRSRQIKAVLACLDSLPAGRSLLLCGDFNDTPISYVYQSVSRRLESAFRAQGRGVGVTFNEEFFPVRIDHIFHTPDWACVDVRIDRSIGASDHYPVIARFRKQRN